MPPAERRRLLVVLAGAAAVAAVMLAYSPWSTRTFVRDDHVLVAEEAPFRRVSPLALFVEPFWPEGTLGDARVRYYRPVVLLSLRVDAALGGTPVEHHFTNALLHAVACLLLATAARQMGGSDRGAVVAALAWGLAPRLTESVAWVSGRTDVLAGLFLFAALALSPEAPARPPPGVLRGRALAVASGAALFAALASKEVAVAGVVALGVLAWRRRRDAGPPGERIVRLVLGVVLPSAVYGALRFIALAGTPAQTRDLGLGLRAMTVLEAVGRYVEMTVDAFHPSTVIGLLGHVDAARVALGVVALSAGAAVITVRVRAGRRTSDGVVAALALAGTALGLVVHVIPLSTAATAAADRFLYVPLAGVAIAAAVAAEGLSPARRVALGAAALALAVPFALVTRSRARDYEDEVRFWLAAAESGHPANMTPWNALANLVTARGRAELGCALFEYARGVEERTAQARLPVHRRTREGLASCLARTGRYEEAVRLTAELVADHPDFGRAHFARGFALIHVLDFDGAQASFERAMALDPVLARHVVGPLAEIAGARVEWARFSDPLERAKDMSGYGTFLQRVGRLHEAEDAALEVARDDRATRAQRVRATDFLAVHGSIDKALAAAAVFRFDEDSTEILELRKRRFAAVTELEPRITTLLGGAPVASARLRP